MQATKGVEDGNAKVAHRAESVNAELQACSDVLDDRAHGLRGCASIVHQVDLRTHQPLLQRLHCIVMALAGDDMLLARRQHEYELVVGPLSDWCGQMFALVHEERCAAEWRPWRWRRGWRLARRLR